MTAEDSPISAPSGAHATEIPARDAAELLGALTTLVSRWTSHEFQREVAVASTINLDPTAIRALHLLGRAGGTATPSQIATELHLSRPSTSKLLARLSAAELLDRAPQAGDRRSALITLTPRGRAAYQGLHDAGLAMIATATRGWAAADRAALVRLLPRFLTSLTTPPPQ